MIDDQDHRTLEDPLADQGGRDEQRSGEALQCPLHAPHATLAG